MGTEDFTFEGGSVIDSKRVGNFISERRKKLGMTQKQLADRLGVTNKAVSKWETGEGYPDISIILNLSKVLRASADELLSGGILDNGAAQISGEEEAEEDDQIPMPPTSDMYKEESSSRKMNFSGTLCVITGIAMIILTFIADMIMEYYGVGEVNEVPMYLVAIIILVIGYKLTKISAQKQSRQNEGSFSERKP